MSGTRPVTALWRSLERHPWLWTAALLAPLVMVPQIDLAVSAWFFDPQSQSFLLRQAPFHDWVRKDMPPILFGLTALLIPVWLAGVWLKKVLFGISGRAILFLLTSLALGPGLIVNTLLKDFWGRPRPSTLREFGGTNFYVPPLMISDQCERNCSFSSGHAALGFWVVAFALLAPPHRRPWAMAAALAFGIVVGYVRIAQGGHFLSDVVFSAVIVVGLTIWLHRRIMGSSPPPKKNRPHTGATP